MKRSVQEIVELVVFGAIALLIGTGVLWLVGWIFTGFGWLALAITGLLWRVLLVLVPIVIIAGLIYWLVTYLMKQRSEQAAVPAATPTATGTGTGMAEPVSPAAQAAETGTAGPAAQTAETGAVKPDSPAVDTAAVAQTTQVTEVPGPAADAGAESVSPPEPPLAADFPDAATDPAEDLPGEPDPLTMSDTGAGDSGATAENDVSEPAADSGSDSDEDRPLRNG